MSASTNRPRPARAPAGQGAAGQGTAGFSLLELVVAFAIVAVALGYILEFFSDGIGGLSDGRDGLRAALLAEARLAELDVAEELRPGVAQGTEPGGLTWQVTVEMFDEEAKGAGPEAPDAPDLLRVTVTVSAPPEDRPLITLHSLRLSRGD